MYEECCCFSCALSLLLSSVRSHIRCYVTGHWEERDWTAFAKQRLPELLLLAEIPFMKIVAVPSIEGDVRWFVVGLRCCLC